MKYKCNISFELEIPSGYKLDKSSIFSFKNKVKEAISENDLERFYIYSKNDDSEVWPRKIKLAFKKCIDKK